MHLKVRIVSPIFYFLLFCTFIVCPNPPAHPSFCVLTLDTTDSDVCDFEILLPLFPAPLFVQDVKATSYMANVTPCSAGLPLLVEVAILDQT